jgi:hypothetical protein
MVDVNEQPVDPRAEISRRSVVGGPSVGISGEQARATTRQFGINFRAVRAEKIGGGAAGLSALANAPMSQLLRFYSGSHPDHRGRMLAELLRQDDHWLELTHDYIQWLFPLADLSRASAHAPLLDKATIDTFRTDAQLLDHMRASFVRMLRFFGLKMSRDGVSKADNWAERKADWSIENTHNSLRLTRMLKNLQALGFAWEAAELQKVLLHLCVTEADCGIDATTQRFWREALSTV